MFFHHLWNLIWRSLCDVPGSLGSTLLGILFPVGIAVLGEVIGLCVFGLDEMKGNWKKVTSIAFAALGLGYTLLFICLMVRNIYTDHTRLASANQQLRDELSQKSEGVSFGITGVVISPKRDDVNGNSTLLQLSVTAYNQGNPVTAHNWNMRIKTTHATFSAVHIFGEDIFNGSPKLPFIDEVLQKPIDTHQETAGLITFLLPRINSTEIIKLINTQSSAATMTITADTSSGKQAQGEELLYALHEQGEGKVPSGDRR